MEWIRDDIIRWWESVTGFDMEMTRFKTLACRDVNSYIAITTDGSTKCKGAYAAPEPGASGWPNPTGQICVDAVTAYLQEGTPVSETIRRCDDIRKFVYVRSVTGGGKFNEQPIPPKKVAKKYMPEGAGIYEAKRLLQLAQGEYLGKVVRWYYAERSKGCITYAASGNLVPSTAGCRPLMELPDVLPMDIDYEWYEKEAEGLLKGYRNG
jgi:hypothetical protein